jgi:hypothetical protein
MIFVGTYANTTGGKMYRDGIRLAPCMRSNHALQAPPRHPLRMPGFPRSKNSLGAPERER